MATLIYRVTGTDRFLDMQRTLFLSAESKAAAADFAFFPPSIYLLLGVAGASAGVLMPWLDRLAVIVGVAGLTLIALGCIRFAAYQRGDADRG